jgi:hypothetical protein
MRRNWAGGGGRGRRWVAVRRADRSSAVTAGSAVGAGGKPAARWWYAIAAARRPSALPLSVAAVAARNAATVAGAAGSVAQPLAWHQCCTALGAALISGRGQWVDLYRVHWRFAFASALESGFCRYGCTGRNARDGVTPAPTAVDAAKPAPDAAAQSSPAWAGTVIAPFDDVERL